MASNHNAANVICLGGRTLGPELAKYILKTYLAAGVDDADRHSRRRDKVCLIEQRDIQ
jgi:ribose 5-phosphate isomerase B